MGFLSPKKNGWMVFTGMRSWVIQHTSFFLGLVQKENNTKMAQTLHFMFRHLIQKENIPLKLPVLEKWIKPPRDVPLSRIRRLHCILNTHQLQHDFFRTGSIKQPITWNQWSTLYFRASFLWFFHMSVFAICFCCYHWIKDSVPHGPSLKEELPPLRRGASARARLRSVSWLHLANLLICVVPQNKRTKWELVKQNQRNCFQNN